MAGTASDGPVVPPVGLTLSESPVPTWALPVLSLGFYILHRCWPLHTAPPALGPRSMTSLHLSLPLCEAARGYGP